jgi:hypothetical protein
MAWVKLDDGFAEHPKLERAGPSAGWMHVAALCYCARNLTDGRIPKARALRLADVPKPAQVIDRLVEVGLWEVDGDDYVIHDYGDYNPSRVQVEAERQAAADRQRRSRVSRRDITRDSRRDIDRSSPVSHGVNSAAPSPSPLDIVCSSVSSSVVGGPDDDDTDRRRLIAAAARILGGVDHDQALADGVTVRNRRAHLAACCDRWATDPALAALAAERSGTAGPDRCRRRPRRTPQTPRSRPDLCGVCRHRDR